MTHDQERAELVALDPLEMLLDAARFAEANSIGWSNPEWAKAARTAVAKARLASQDQKPAAQKEPAFLEGEDLGDALERVCGGVIVGRPSLQAKAAPPPAAGVRVKTLEWEHIPAGSVTSERYDADSAIGIYSVYIRDSGDIEWGFNRVGRLQEATNKNEAKAAAQADYERRILSALSHQPAAAETNASAEARLSAFIQRLECECDPYHGFTCGKCQILSAPHASDCAGQESRAKATEGKAGMAGGQAPVRRSTAGTGLRVGVADAGQPATSEIMDATAGRDRQPSEPHGCPTPDEAAIRADEREKCAKIADRIAEDHEDGRDACMSEGPPNTKGALTQARQAQTAASIAAAIRSARDGGEV